MKHLFFIVVLLHSLLSAAPSGYVPRNFSYLRGMDGFSDELLTMHFKLYEGYVNHVNLLDGMLKSLSNSGKETSYEYGALKRRFGWEFDGMRLHELYFGNLGGDGTPAGTLAKEIGAQYGSVEQWQKIFSATGLMRGIGWVILMLDPESKRLFTIWIDEHDTGELATGKAIVVMDVWEHAYMPQYGLDRAKYIDAFFHNLDWSVAEERFISSNARPAPAGK